MSSTIQIQLRPNMTAEQKLEQIQYPVETLKYALSAFTKISEGLTPNEHTALFNLLHHQICEIDQVLK
ncbi:hypothetical protein [Acinetobacter populi]|uniref:Uncharacterized protein n=1 Tax=Acinetobacter populi TaxID=1582270 RepID=A0A1Z9Z2P2_9GAMM|nr:hypothetical protein [Acinetobacter populi]OUY08730.1 hypothetical protein CAP51_03705 [Acinetobacter populi]